MLGELAPSTRRMRGLAAAGQASDLAAPALRGCGSFQRGWGIAPRSDPSRTLVALPFFKVDAVDNSRGQRLTRQQLPEGRCGPNPRRLSAVWEARQCNGRRFVPLRGKEAGEAARRRDDASLRRKLIDAG